MRILGIDTSTKFLSLGIFEPGKVYAYNLELGTRHSALLLPAIKRVLEALGWRIDELDYFACGAGPGSFTGIRVGLATLKGLCWALRKPLIAIPTLDILAASLKGQGKAVVAAVDAKRGMVYSAFYQAKGDILRKIAADCLLKRDAFLRKIKPGSIVTGDAAGLLREEILRRGKGVTIAEKDCWYPKGHCIIELALARIKAKKISNTFTVKPVYLYPKECQIR
jgi:tRNA threonylcarbamoyladenosine biosynthesis protein TsaB